MPEPPEYYHNLPLRLSKVLDDIGVNARMVIQNRRLCMLTETIQKIRSDFHETGMIPYLFGSRVEGTTTFGLISDIDNLLCIRAISVIQDWSEWEQGKIQYLMLQDETTSPGYCLLQAVRADVPQPELEIKNEHQCLDKRGRVLLKHSLCLEQREELTRHGPAMKYSEGPGMIDYDFVTALHCSSWPRDADPWLQSVSSKLTEEMKRYFIQQGCFVVPVGSKTGIYPDLEWRISTSLTERYVMLNLNLTQVKCYILMKMILKTFIEPKCEDVVSSFVCKNILLHHIVASEDEGRAWNEYDLLTHLNPCLQTLYNCILKENCPHFIIPGNNLLAGKFSADVKCQLLQVMGRVTENIEQSLLGITIDDLGNRLREQSSGLSENYLKSAHKNCAFTAWGNIIDLTTNLSFFICETLKIVCMFSSSNNMVNFLIDSITRLLKINLDRTYLQYAASNLLYPFLCTITGSITASADIQNVQTISHDAMKLFSFGLNSDVSTGRLKLASALYCAGNLARCHELLYSVAMQRSVTSLCFCSDYVPNPKISKQCLNLCLEKNEKYIKESIAFCIMYLPCENYCIPKELKYELYKCTKEDKLYKDENDYWMDWAVVDAIPYFYFLKYKVSQQLYTHDVQQMTLQYLAESIDTAINLGHKETAWNLLGQCLEQENRYKTAMCCYMFSLKVRGRNNVAKWHVCRLLARLYHQSQIKVAHA